MTGGRSPFLPQKGASSVYQHRQPLSSEIVLIFFTGLSDVQEANFLYNGDESLTFAGDVATQPTARTFLG